MPRWRCAWLVETGGADAADATACELLLAFAFASEAAELLALNICTTTCETMRCTGQYKLISHNATKCANTTASQTSRLEREEGYWA